MGMTTSSRGKNKSGQKISASIRKPVIGRSTDRLSQAIDFAQKTGKKSAAVLDAMTMDGVRETQALAKTENETASGNVSATVSAWSLMPKSPEAKQITCAWSGESVQQNAPR